MSVRDSHVSSPRIKEKELPPSYDESNKQLVRARGRDDAGNINRTIKAARREQRGRLILVIVGSRETRDELQRQSHLSWFNMYGKARSKSEILITTAKEFDTSRSIKKALRRGMIDNDELFIICSAVVPNLSFDLLGFHALHIYRCEADMPTSRPLVVDGSSKFQGVRLGDWDPYKQREALYLGNNVLIGLDTSMSAWPTVPDGRKDIATSSIEILKEIKLEGTWWEKYKAPVTALMGSVLGSESVLIGIKASQNGFAFSFKAPEAAAGAAASVGPMLMKAGALGMKASTVATAAGPAVLVGAAVATAVYFIPWRALFDWLGGAIKRFCDGIYALWSRFMNWLTTQLGLIAPEPPRDGRQHRPRKPAKAP